MTRESASRPLLRPLVPLYRIGLAVREFGLRSGIEPLRRLKWPVVSVGNLSTGGTGKTPLTIALAKALAAHGLHVDVLSRGYGRGRKAPACVDPNGSAAEFGDEALEIACAAGVPVYVAAERYQAGLLAEVDASERAREQGSKGASWQVSESASQPVGVHLLDDGFQHRQLHRDVDILLLSRRDLEDRLLPAGNLRESITAILRASVLAIPADDRQLERFLRESAPMEVRWTGPIWRLRRRMEIPRAAGPVVAFCGIARPEQFFAGLENAGLKLAARFAFPDHHRYSEADLARLSEQAKRLGATALLTTEKDRPRLGGFSPLMPIQAVPLRVEVEDERAAVDWLVKRISGAN